MGRLKLPSPQDIGAITALLLALPFALLFRLRRPNVWLVSERPSEARDNSYWFFRYVHDNSLHADTYYVIDKDALDAERIRRIAPNRLIPFGSLRHYFYYVASSVHISAHVGGGMPNPRACRLMERAGLLRNRKVFLQHGITKDTLDWLFRKNARIDLFCCAAAREMQHVLDAYGYSTGQMALTGFCRYDQLTIGTKPTGDRRVLLLPTWRKYLAGLDEADFRGSTYFQTYSHLLADPALHQLLALHQCELIFHLHPGMQDYSELFQVDDTHITISDGVNDIQTLLKESSLLVTDYSSVFFDFAYMRRPVLYYQFDYSEFRTGHWATGYFDYEADGFGRIAHTRTELLEAIDNIIRADYSLESRYAKRADEFFAHNDTNNCARTFDAITRLTAGS